MCYYAVEVAVSLTTRDYLPSWTILFDLLKKLDKNLVSIKYEFGECSIHNIIAAVGRNVSMGFLSAMSKVAVPSEYLFFLIHS